MKVYTWSNMQICLRIRGVWQLLDLKKKKKWHLFDFVYSVLVWPEWFFTRRHQWKKGLTGNLEPKWRPNRVWILFLRSRATSFIYTYFIFFFFILNVKNGYTTKIKTINYLFQIFIGQKHEIRGERLPRHSGMA